MAQVRKLQRFGLAIDFETSGLSMPDYTARHQGVSFGALIFDMKTFEIIEELYCLIKYDSKYEWSTKAESIHGLTREFLEVNGMDMKDAAAELFSMIFKYNGPQKLIVLGHRKHFDIAFMNQLARTVEIEIEYDPISIDTSCFGAVLLGVEMSDQIFDTLGFETRGKHNALEDIKMTLESIQRMKMIFDVGVETLSNETLANG